MNPGTTHAERSQYLNSVIRKGIPARYTVQHEWRDLRAALTRYGEAYGGIDLTPAFQRGHVWTTHQQEGFIASALRNLLPESALNIQLNCPNWTDDDYDGDLLPGVVCIDGLQRLTAVLKFMDGELSPLGLTIRDFDNSSFHIKTHFCLRIQMFEHKYEADLLQHYLDHNSGGTPHSPSEIDRVTALQKAAALRKNPKPDEPVRERERT